MVNWKKTMMASAGGGGGWMAQLLSTSTATNQQFENAVGFNCRFLSDGSVIQQQLRRFSFSYYTTWTKWTPDGDLDFHKKITGSGRIDTTQLNLFVDYDDSDKIHERSRGTGTEVNGIDPDITSYFYSGYPSNQSPTGFAWMPLTSRIYHRDAFGGMTAYRTTNGSAGTKVSYSNISGDYMGLDQGFMGDNTMGACWRENSGNNLIAARLRYDAFPGSWTKRTVIGKSASDRQTVAPNIATTSFTHGASTSSNYDLYVAGTNEDPPYTDWSYVVKYNSSDGSLAGAKIIDIVNGAGFSRSYTGARGMAVGSDGQVWVVLGEDEDQFVILHLSSSLTLNKALRFRRNGVASNKDFSNWQYGKDYHGIDLNEDGSALAFTTYLLDTNNLNRSHVTFKIPSDLSIVDGYYPLPATTAGVSGFVGDGTNNPTTGAASVHITDFTSSVTCIDAAYTSNVNYTLSRSETIPQSPTSDTKTIGSDASWSDYGPESL